jgi:hypothetical protein
VYKQSLGIIKAANIPVTFLFKGFQNHNAKLITKSGKKIPENRGFPREVL